MKVELSANLKALYKIHIPAYMADLRKASEERDLFLLQHVAHNLSPAMGAIGDTVSSNLFRRLEKETLTDSEISTIIEEAEIIVAEALANL